MKKLFTSQTTKILSLVVFSVVMLAIFIPALGAVIGGIFLMGGGASGVSYAVGTAITGTVTTGKNIDANSDYYEQDISKLVTTQMPDRFPIDTIMRRIRKPETATNIKVEYEEVTVRPVVGVTAALNTADASSADFEVDLTVASTTHLKADDILRFPTITGALDSKELKLLVVEILTATTMTVTAINGANTDGRWVPTIADATTFYRIASAKDETDAQTTVKSLTPARDYNYCQSHMIQLEQTRWDSMMKSKSGYDYAQRKMLEMYQFREELETSHIFGTKSKLTQSSDVENPYKYTADGIVNKISREIEYANAGVTKVNILAMMKETFANNAGSERRLGVFGSDLIEGIDNVASFQRNVGKDEVKQVYGVKVYQLETSFGILDIVHSHVLDRQGWAAKGLILDLDHIIKKDFDPLHAEKLELQKAGIKKVVNAYTLEEVSCLTTRYSGSDGVHAIWKRGA